jgi:CBS domain-containing protein
MARVKDVMSKDVATIGPDGTVAESARLMRDQDIGDVIVIDGERPVGILTDRDIAIRVVADGRDPDTVSVRDASSNGVATVDPDDDVDTAVATMRDLAVRRLPVVEGERLVGVVSLGDLAVEHDGESALADISAAPPDQ